MKAQLVESGIPPPRTHDVSALAHLLKPSDSLPSELQLDLDWLTTLAVEIRYPGASANAEDAARAVAIAARVRALARSNLIPN